MVEKCNQGEEEEDKATEDVVSKEQTGLGKFMENEKDVNTHGFTRTQTPKDTRDEEW